MHTLQVARLVDMQDAQNPFVWLSGAGKGRLFDFVYKTYSPGAFTQFQKNYANLTNPPDWFERDFGKPNETFSTDSTWHGKVSRGVRRKRRRGWWSEGRGRECLGYTLMQIASFVANANRRVSILVLVAVALADILTTLTLSVDILTTLTLSFALSRAVAGYVDAFQLHSDHLPDQELHR
jgi:hypothetical protein